METSSTTQIQITTTTRPATIPMGQNRGKTTNTVVEVVSSTGQVLEYRCADCNKAFAKYASAFAHRNSHFRRGGKSGKAGDFLAPLQSILRENEELTRTIQRLRSRLNTERSARRKAERRIEQIERLFVR